MAAVKVYRLLFNRSWYYLCRLWPVALLALMVLVFFWDIFLKGKSLCMRDVFCEFLPNLTFSRQAIRDGAIPLWNPYSRCGQPFIADPQTAFFYPLNLLFYLLPVTLALKLSLALHQFIAGVTCYALMRHWKLERFPALLSAVAYAFSSRLIALMEFHAWFNTLAWLPLPLLLLSRFIEQWMQPPAETGVVARFRSGILTIILMALVLAVQFLAGYAQTFMFTLMLLGAYALLRPLAAGNIGAVVVSYLALAFAGLLVVGLVMPQLLLTTELVSNSIRAAGLDPQMDMASLHPRLLFSWILPFFAGRPGYDYTWWGFTKNPQTNLTMFEFCAGTAYIGIAPLILALTAMLSLWPSRQYKATGKSRFLILFFIVCALVWLLLAMGKYTPLYLFFYNNLPGFNKFRWPSRSLEIVVFSTSVLAGFGLQAVLDFASQPAKPRFNRYKILWLVCSIVTLATAVGCFYVRSSPAFFTMLTGGAFVHDPTRPHLFDGLVTDYRLGVFFLALSLMALAPILMGWRRRAVVLACGGLVAAAFLNLFIIGRQIHFVADDDVYQETPKEVLKKISSVQHVRVATTYAMETPSLYGVRDEMPYRFAKQVGIIETWLPYHVFKLEGGGPLKLQRHAFFASMFWELHPGDEQWERLVDLMNVRYLVYGPQMYHIVCGLASPVYNIWDNKDCLPRALLTEDWKVIADDQAAVKTLFSPLFDPRKSAIIDQLPPDQAAAMPQPVAAKESLDSPPDSYGVSSIVYGWNRVDLKASAMRQSLLVLNDTWYPGWKALVDGRPQPIVRANFMFRGVFIEPGRHHVSFIYDPWQFKAGVASIAGTFLIMCAFAYIGHRSSNTTAKV